MDKERIYSLAYQFRKMIVKCNPQNFLLYSMRMFPKGACGDSCILLGRYLNQNNIHNIDYVCGIKVENNQTKTHAWLEIGDLIVDITADQFDDVQEEVIVTSDKTWYKQYRESQRFKIETREYNDRAEMEFIQAYHLITSKKDD